MSGPRAWGSSGGGGDIATPCWGHYCCLGPAVSQRVTHWGTSGAPKGCAQQCAWCGFSGAPYSAGLMRFPPAEASPSPFCLFYRN